MGKAAAAALAAVTAGMVALTALGNWMPASWAEGASLALTGLGLVGASFAVQRREPREAAQHGPPAHHPQEA